MALQSLMRWESADKLYWSAWMILCTIGWIGIEGVLAVKGISSIGPSSETMSFLGTSVSVFLITSLSFFFLFLILFVIQSIVLKECLNLPKSSITIWVCASTLSATLLLAFIYHHSISGFSFIWHILGVLIIIIIQWISLKLHSKQANLVFIGNLIAVLLAIFIPATIPSVRIMAGFIYGAVSGAFIVNQRVKSKG